MWHLLIAAAVGLATMRAAMERGDIDQAAQLGARAGVVTIERALGAPERTLVLAGIAAAPLAEDRAELLEPLARAAGRGDRRIAVPAAHAARDIARELVQHGLPDDLGTDDAVAWRAAWTTLAQRPGTFIEVRVLAAEIRAALDRIAGNTDLDLTSSLGDADPAYRRAIVENLPQPVPQAARAPLGKLVANDPDAAVALAAAHVLCADLAAEPAVAVARPVLDAIGAAGIERLRKLAAGQPKDAVREAARCLAAAK